VHPYTVILGKLLAPDFGLLGHLWRATATTMASATTTSMVMAIDVFHEAHVTSIANIVCL
jgi:hypothetical protein